MARRFFDFVDTKSSDCWIFTGSKNPKGYGLLGPQYCERRAHRYAWFLANGDIPAGYFVLHRCDNPSCVKVEHLFLGTAQDNTTDMMRKGRQHYNPNLREIGFKKGNPGYGYRRNKYARLVG